MRTLISTYSLSLVLFVSFPSIVFLQSEEVHAENETVKVVQISSNQIESMAQKNLVLKRLLLLAHPTIGVPYQWGGTQLNKGIDCSNYTWQLFRGLGLPYKRFLSTMTMSRLRKSNGLQKISLKEARPGDLLVYGHRDESKKWYGHVVILIDKDGLTTGHKGLVLGAHGGSIESVQYITFQGFEAGYFKHPQMRLCNVLRVDGIHSPNDKPTESPGSTSITASP